MSMRDLPDMYAQNAMATSSRDEGIHIRQIMNTHMLQVLCNIFVATGTTFDEHTISVRKWVAVVYKQSLFENTSTMPSTPFHIYFQLIKRENFGQENFGESLAICQICLFSLQNFCII